MTKKSTEKKPATDKFQWMTEQFISLIEKGVNPWRKEWQGGDDEIMNFLTKEPYKGRNPLILTMDTLFRGADHPFYCGAQQGFAKGWTLKKGCKSAYVTYANVVIKEGEGDEDDKKAFFVKWYPVFNINCWEDANSDHKLVDYLPSPSTPINHDDRLAVVDQFIKDSNATIKTQGSQPCYIPSEDTILMPKWENFSNAGAYYGTALHELTHWTGHKSRCNRDQRGEFGTASYAKEELIAEMGAALLCHHFQVKSDLENHASYLKGWLSKAKEDPKFLFNSMGEARKAFEFLIDSQG